MAQIQDSELSEILVLIEKFSRKKLVPEKFIPGHTHIPVSGKLLDSEDISSVIEATLDMWFTTGRFTTQFESELARRLQRRRALFVNSGSSANLLAISSLTSSLLGNMKLVSGDEIITAALGFPTTINPIIQNNLKPVLVDVHRDTFNIKAEDIEKKITKKTKGVFLAHTLGNPFELQIVQELCKEYNLYLIEDNCDAFGSTYNGKSTGSFGEISTLSFYPAHHITTGEGGAVLANSPKIIKALESFRDWGRDCYCESGRDDTCHKRFDWQLGHLPHGYDHKYIYSNIGYNLKATDLQAALGFSQIKKLDEFINARKNNFNLLIDDLKDLDYLEFAKATPNSDPAWFGFPITVLPNSYFNRNDLIRHLNSLNIGTRLMFGGNLTRQPAYKDVFAYSSTEFQNADFITENSFWIGVQPSLKVEMLHFVATSIREFVSSSIKKGKK